MVEADGVAVAVAAYRKDGQVRVRQFHALGDGQGPAVDAVDAVGIEVARQAAGAADAGDHDQLFRFQAEIGRRPFDGGLHGEIAAARAPVWFDAVMKIFCRCHQIISLHWR